MMFRMARRTVGGHVTGQVAVETASEEELYLDVLMTTEASLGHRLPRPSVAGRAVLRAREFGMLCMRCRELTCLSVYMLNVCLADHNDDCDKAHGE